MNRKIKRAMIALAISMGSLCACSTNTADNVATTMEVDQEKNNVESTSSSMLETFTQVNVVEETVELIEENPYEEYCEYPIFSEEYMYYYVNNGTLDLPDFKIQLKELKDDLDRAEHQQVYVSPTGYFRGNGFECLNESSKYIYSGEIKDGKVHGAGVVYYMAYIPFRGVQPAYIKIYEGYFKNGLFDGFGITYDYETYERDASMDGVCRVIARNYNEDYDRALHLFYNPILYMGEYEKGDKKGTGIEFIYPKEDDTRYISGLYNVSDIQIRSGKYESDELTEGTMYLHETMIYEGDIKDGKKHGMGAMYFQNTNIVAFKGEFYKDEPRKGTLYDNQGNIICSGEWEKGRCGKVDFYDEYYKYSEISARDVKEKLDVSYYDLEFWDDFEKMVEGETKDVISDDAVVDWDDRYAIVSKEIMYLYENILTEEAYTEAIKKEYELWDILLNEVYQEIRRIYPESEFEVIKQEQRAWITEKEAEAEDAKNSVMEYKEDAYYFSLINSTKSRVDYLYEYLDQ